MLKRFLSIFQKQSKNQPEVQSNLFEESPVVKDTLKSKLIICVLALLVITLFVFDKVLSNSLNSQKIINDQILSKIETYSNVESLYKDISNKITQYKKLKSARLSMTDKVETTTQNVQADIDINYIKIQEKDFEIKASSKNLLSFSSLILNYLNSGKVSEISLKSASLSSTREVYDVEFIGKFK